MSYPTCLTYVSPSPTYKRYSTPPSPPQTMCVIQAKKRSCIFEIHKNTYAWPHWYNQKTIIRLILNRYTISLVSFIRPSYGVYLISKAYFSNIRNFFLSSIGIIAAGTFRAAAKQMKLCYDGGLHYKKRSTSRNRCKSQSIFLPECHLQENANLTRSLPQNNASGLCSHTQKNKIMIFVNVACAKDIFKVIWR